MADVLLLGEHSSNKSVFINMLLGVSLLPEETALSSLPVVRFVASRSLGLWVRLVDQDAALAPFKSWSELSDGRVGCEYGEVSIDSHPLFDTGIVLWNTPGIDTSLKQQPEHLLTFLSTRQNKFVSVLFFISGKLSQLHIDFLRQWPSLLERTTVIMNVMERKSENERQIMEASVREVTKRELNDIPIILLYTGDVCEEFVTLSNEMRQGYSDVEMVLRWEEICKHTDEMSRKYSSKKTRSLLSEAIAKTVKWDDIDYSDIGDALLLQYVDNNVAAAQFELGNRMLRKGDFKAAVKYFRVLAEKDHAEAMYALSQCYREGNGVDRNMDTAYSWVRAAAEKGIAEAQFLMYTFLSSGKELKVNNQQAIMYLHKAAASQHVRACAILGGLYLAGIDIPVDYESGVKYLSIAVDAGDADAMVAMAASYKKGFGVKQDAAEMLKLLQRAAALNHPDALTALGDAYLLGQNVRMDKSRALTYFLQAADAGAVDAQMRAASCYQKGDGVPSDLIKAMQYYLMAADNGDTDAQYVLGTAYRTGNGVLQDTEKAIHWLQLSAASGNAQAAEALRELEEAPNAESAASKKGACFVVTAAFGDVGAPEVIFFQHFRDTILARHAWGRLCIAVYQSVGPSCARIISSNTMLRSASRILLLRVQGALVRCLIR